MKIKIVNVTENAYPEYATEGSAGMDLRAHIDGDKIVVKPMERTVVSTGISIELPIGYEAQVRGRSGLALKSGIFVHTGTIDSDYRGIVGVILVNLSDKDFEIKNGDRIAQLVVSKYERVELEPVLVLSDSERGSGGFGHTGK